ncbi:MAG: NAD+ synthase [Planctomycetes bacterium]|nr:NAD+ synthase [Planctomycetota bacterium]
MRFRIALAQINPIVGDFKGNTEKIIASIEKARAHSADLIAFPEMALCGYPPEDLVFNRAFTAENTRCLKIIARASKNISAVIGLTHRLKNDIYNAAAFIHNKKIINIYHKIFLPNYGVFDEKRYFKPGEHIPVFHINDTSIGINICEDIWHVGGPAHQQANKGRAGLIINISASPYHEQKLTQRQMLLSYFARNNKTYAAYINMTGGQDELVFDGGSMLVSPKGALIARAGEFKEDLIFADINPLTQNACGNADEGITEFNLKANKIKRSKANVKCPINKKLPLLEEIYSALVLGTKDYLHKNGFSKAVLGLSGGIDSALVAAIAVDALGRENVAAVTMPSMYSSTGTKNDSEQIAHNMEIQLLKIPIDDIFKSYLYQLRDHFIGQPENIAEENLQARIRGTLLMALSNKFGWMVLGTGNKSELSVGYCTLYGDMASGFAVIKDIPKIMVYQLAKYFNQKSGKEIIPKSVFKRPPSAELRPNQKDDDSLPPYNTLDPILQKYIEGNQSIPELIKSGFKSQMVKRITRLVDTSEYKRRQAPAGIKITRRAFGKDRRMPITNKFI